ncbi:MAG: hypothetical protein JSU70_22975 [Phycisphaerales bacterium]|nr:MAG: hypothetical protein JSU70_22975 [Phycisphaerales bacterium]
MKRTFIYLSILFSAVLTVEARTVELTLCPAKAPGLVHRHSLLPKAEEQIDSDAYPLYQKAIQSLPQNYDRGKIDRWRNMPLKDLPIEDVKSVLQKLNPSLQLLRQASLCKKCNFPAVKSGRAKDKLMKDLSKYRQFAFVLAVQARLQIAGNQYDEATDTIRTGFAMARHLGDTAVLVQGLTGVATAALMCGQIEQFIQAPDTPSLYWGLQSLPSPLVDLNKTIELETSSLRNYDKNPLVRRELENKLKPAHERARLVMKRFDRDVTALQCVEAIRLYAGSHNGELPNELGDVSEVHIPNNPATQKPFVYRRTDNEAVLEGPDPEGTPSAKVLRYELKVREPGR